MRISVAIITLDEQDEIADAIATLGFADEIVVVDSGSTDRTRELCRALGAEVIVQPWRGFGPHKQLAVERCSHDWVFGLDADERVSPALDAFLRELKTRPESELADAYAFTRRNYYLGHPMRSRYPDWQLRLFHRGRGRWQDVEIHEQVEMRAGARVERVPRDILHYTIRSAGQHHRTIGERWAPVHARQMAEAGRRTSMLEVMTAAPRAFFDRFVVQGGVRDGFAGYCVSMFTAYEAFLHHLMRWEQQRATDERRPS